MTYTSVALMENLIKMNAKSLMPSFYFKNYHSFILLNSIIFLILSIPFPSVDDWSLNGMRKLLDYPIIFVLVVLAFSNFALYSKSFISKSYPSIEDNIYDSLNIYCVYVAIVLKVMSQVLFLSHTHYMNNNIKFPYIDWMMSTMALFYFVSLVSVSHFIFHSVRGTYIRHKRPTNNNHWITEYLSPKQVRRIKNISSNGKIISVYFNGFLLSEIDNSVVIREYKLKLNAFRDYITLNNFKLDDLNDDDLKVIEMLGI